MKAPGKKDTKSKEKDKEKSKKAMPNSPSGAASDTSLTSGGGGTKMRRYKENIEAADEEVTKQIQTSWA